MTAEPTPARPGAAQGPLRFDRHLVLDQLGGWRGMVDASLPTIAFLVANGVGGLAVGIWVALGAAVLVFVLRLARRESVQQAVSGLFAVAVAVALAAASGQARDFFVLGLVRNGLIGAVLLGSIVVRRPLVGVIAEFLSPSHLGALASHSLSLRGYRKGTGATGAPAGGRPAAGSAGESEPVPELHWRQDRRMLRGYSWLTLLWAAMFLLRLGVQALFYQRNDVGLLGTSSVLLGLPLTAVVLGVTLWAVARLHRHRTAGGSTAAAAGGGSADDGRDRPAA